MKFLRVNYNKFIIWFFCIMIVNAEAKEELQERPNFIIILADDLGYGDVGYNGSAEIFTPNIDKLAQEGIICSNGYVTHPYCGPSRAGLITGKYQARFGMEVNCSYSPYDLQMGLSLSEKTFATRLKLLDYSTGIIGKWHLGAAKPFHPNNRGFDYFYGFLSGGHCYFPEDVSTIQTLISDDGSINYSGNEGGTLPLLRNDKNVEFSSYLTRSFSKDAVDFIKNNNRPFCLFLSYNAPHGPLEAPNETIKKYAHIKDWNRRVYAAMVDEMDQGIGLIIEALKKEKKYDNTLIIFLSDNGGVAPKDGFANENWASNFPFKHGKGSFYEGGIHVPFIFHWPKMIDSNVYDGLVSSLDIAPTIVSLAGGDFLENEFDGYDIIPHLLNNLPSPHDALFWREAGGLCWAVRTEKYKMLKNKWDAKDFELYNLATHPNESKNIKKTNSDIVKKLALKWNDWNVNNSRTSLLQSYDYQKKRQEMYNNLNEQLKKDASQKSTYKIKF